MKILNANAQPIEACVQLPLVGEFYLSLSTIMNPPDMRVFVRRVSGASDDVTHLFFPDSSRGETISPTARNIATVFNTLQPTR